MSGFNTEKQPVQSGKSNSTENDLVPDATSIETNSHETELLSSLGIECSGEILSDGLVLLCCEDSLHLYSKKSMIQVLLLPLLNFKFNIIMLMFAHSGDMIL